MFWKRKEKTYKLNAFIYLKGRERAIYYFRDGYGNGLSHNEAVAHMQDVIAKLDNSDSESINIGISTVVSFRRSSIEAILMNVSEL